MSNALTTLTREQIAARRAQDQKRASDTTIAEQDMARKALQSGVSSGSIPNIPPIGSRTRISSADRAAFDRRMSGLPGSAPTALSGPATIQNTGVTGVSAATPDFGSTRRSPQGGLESYMPNDTVVKGGGKWVSTTGSTPASRYAATKTPVVNTPPPGENLATTTTDGIRSAVIDPKYQTPADQIGKGEIVGSGKSAPDATTGIGIGPDVWRFALKQKHPQIFVPGSPENLAFIAAHQNDDGTSKPIDPNTAMGIADNFQKGRVAEAVGPTQPAEIQGPPIQPPASTASQIGSKAGEAIASAPGAVAGAYDKYISKPIERASNAVGEAWAGLRGGLTGRTADQVKADDITSQENKIAANGSNTTGLPGSTGFYPPAPASNDARMAGLPGEMMGPKQPAEMIGPSIPAESDDDRRKRLAMTGLPDGQ